MLDNPEARLFLLGGADKGVRLGELSKTYFPPGMSYTTGAYMRPHFRVHYVLLGEALPLVF